MFIIDCKKKGNVVRFYLGDDPKYHGDDWKAYSYEDNCGRVYKEYILGHKDISFPFEYSVLEPSDTFNRSSNFCRDDFKNGIVPCIVAVDNTKIEGSTWDIDDFERAVGVKHAVKYYFGEEMEPDEN